MLYNNADEKNIGNLNISINLEEGMILLTKYSQIAESMLYNRVHLYAERQVWRVRHPNVINQERRYSKDA